MISPGPRTEALCDVVHIHLGVGHPLIVGGTILGAGHEGNKVGRAVVGGEEDGIKGKHLVHVEEEKSVIIRGVLVAVTNTYDLATVRQ